MGVESKRGSGCQQRVRPDTNNNIKMGRGGQEVLKMDDILASKALPLGKSQMDRQALVKEYVVKLAMILLEHISNLLDSVVTLAARKTKEKGLKNILSEITGRDLGMQIGNPVPESSNQSHRLTATIFLNRNWQADSDGGELRLSPSATTLATI